MVFLKHCADFQILLRALNVKKVLWGNRAPPQRHLADGKEKKMTNSFSFMHSRQRCGCIFYQICNCLGISPFPLNDFPRDLDLQILFFPCKFKKKRTDVTF